MPRLPHTLVLPMLCCSLLAWQQPRPADPLAVAKAQAAAGRCSDALVSLEEIIRSNPKSDAGTYLLLAHCYRELRQPEATVKVFRDGLRIWPASPLLERGLGELLFQAQYDSSEAGALLEHAARLLPRDPEAKHYYAQWAYLNARDRICVKQEQDALTLPHLNELALLQMNTLLGMCQSRLENASGARAAFERAEAINAKQQAYDPVAAMQYVQFLTRYNDEARAASVIDRIVQRVPNFGPAHLQKAKYLDGAGQPALAIPEARLALASAGNDLNAERAIHTLLARCLSAVGKTEEASAEQQWIQDHPNPEAPHP